MVELQQLYHDDQHKEELSTSGLVAEIIFSSTVEFLLSDLRISGIFILESDIIGNKLL